MTEITRSSVGLREVLFDTLEAFVDGRISATHAKTVSKVADSILKSAALDLGYQSLISNSKDSLVSITPISLGLPKP